ncbi:uncharacterized protein BT62DRAFT_1079042 [Guyanagaster necrorhizus]|uniref:Uncharacterized protein n=1 Tax=Guyanagaster necrorhizus TaxID=856835 RepID=A0A9P7VK97_9AGAR|nr:uncharacterized protein BT62DRAFT_1079042 [Guyanagaster necrorhizus MCA 3950]KAG7442663.1 hypothetical protein BT62DRAFT_1079042 [Guyanagaster necrorhizus MCA 3950]
MLRLVRTVLIVLRQGAALVPVFYHCTIATMNTFDPDRAKLSEEVETIFYAHPGQYVREVVVVGVSLARKRGIRPWLTPSDGGPKDIW